MNISELDLYDILGILQDADQDAIKKAYRRKALKCHPDKNPDNPHAAAEWEKLAKALEVLSDEDARATYDKVLKAKKAAELRNKALEGKRRKIKEDLESREASYKKEQETSTTDIISLEEKIKRLREEGSQTLKKEQELLRNELHSAPPLHEDTSPKLKIKWKAQKGDVTNGGYDYAFLKRIFGKYGQVKNLILSSKRNGSAIIEFSSAAAAEMAVSNEFGLPNNPLQLTWLSGKPEKKPEEVVHMESAVEKQFEEDVLQLLLQAEANKQKQPTSKEQSSESWHQSSEHSEVKKDQYYEHCPPSHLNEKEGDDG
ncbi:dnaJ homolog subfamily C member 17-like [Lytechinus variegatus]|uniref:dnaJ homolog subfamily C member 17-like n=1 Tax=Lytechinus variegatus TaxID=7654 RepID=UPI001BB10D91|nr:dnaJ homolog subfamily C member 17-like [Lytechinus variegatus]